jgi:hypothetical protein
MNLSKLVDSAGKLIKIKGFSFPELPDEIAAIELTFEQVQCFICVVEDTDEIKLNSKVDISEFIESDVLICFSEFLGRELLWAWSLTNNQGYNDGLKFQFQNSDVALELIVEASSIKQFTVKKV